MKDLIFKLLNYSNSSTVFWVLIQLNNITVIVIIVYNLHTRIFSGFPLLPKLQIFEGSEGKAFFTKQKQCNSNPIDLIELVEWNGFFCLNPCFSPNNSQKGQDTKSIVNKIRMPFVGGSELTSLFHFHFPNFNPKLGRKMQPCCTVGLDFMMTDFYQVT